MKIRFFCLSSLLIASLCSCTGISLPSTSKGSIEESSSNDPSSSKESAPVTPPSTSATSTSKEEIADHIKVYAEKSRYTHIWAWTGKDNNLFSKWPGERLLSYDDNWNYYEFSPEYKTMNLIFSKNGEDQTGDLTISAPGAYYWYEGSWHGTDPILNPPAPSQSSGDQGLRVLHCFDWHLDAIRDNLDAIKAAGFDAVQTTPLQQPKQYNTSWTQYESNNWWRMYQPVSFTIGSTPEWIGTPESLASLTSSAKAKGIKVIVDVVANHLAGDDSKKNFFNEVQNYESDIYNNKAQTVHEYVEQSDDTVKATVWGNIGMPDLNTANSKVQERVLSYLKALLDKGVDGFRFDAAKHIETSNDGTYASSFWANTLGEARSYAKNKGKDLFAYGEILGPTGGGRPYGDYIKYAGLDAITDCSFGDTLRESIKDKKGNSNASYYTSLAAKHNVVWAESHDTYMNSGGGSKGVSQTDIDRTYALLSARSDANLLYFQRPSGRIGKANEAKNWNQSIVLAANKFHSLIPSATVSTGKSGALSFVERHGEGKDGVVLVNQGSAALEASFRLIGNGSYKDLITQNTYSVANQKITVPANSCLILAK